MPVTLSGLHVFPVKSCAPLAYTEAEVEARGLVGDRRWLVVDAAGRFVTGRQKPRMTLIRAVPIAGGIRLSAPGVAPLTVAAPAGNPDRLVATIWKDRVDAAVCDHAADAWLSAFLGIPARLVYMDEFAVRPVSLTHGREGDRVSFADAYPLLLVSQAALDALNARLASPVPMARFRPNLVVAGADAHAEDAWRRIRIGDIAFDVVKPCVRCVFTTVDPELGAFDGGGEPLNTLKGYRRSGDGVTFGQNVIPRGTGILRVGDPVEVIGQESGR
jgi:uncharacterized protein YcbX